MTENSNTEYSFLKINGNTYRLVDCLKWGNAKKLSSDISKCKSFSVEGFTKDGGMRKINFEIGKEVRKENYDLIFMYDVLPEQAKPKTKRKSSYQSFSSTGKRRNYSTTEIHTSSNKIQSRKGTQKI